MKDNRRRQYYIKKTFQGKFILQFSGLLILGFAALASALHVYSSSTLTTAFVDSKLRVMSTADFLLPALTLFTLCVAAIVALAAAVRLLHFSHRIAGPLYRLEKTVEAIGKGQLNIHCRVRAGDELQDFARSMEEMLSDLRGRAETLKTQNARLREIIQAANQSASFPPELLKELKETQSRLDDAAGHFQV